MNLRYDILENTGFSYDDLVNLLHIAFHERTKQGLYFSCYNFTVDDYKRNTKGGTTFIAYDPDNHELYGMLALTPRRDEEGILYGNHEYLAVLPASQHSGVATKLFQLCEKKCIEMNASYILSDTAIGAKSSVRYHLKQGFQIIGYEAFSNTNYYSYIFKKSLPPNSDLNDALSGWRLLKAYIIFRLKFHVHKKPTLLYRIYLRILNLIIK